MFAILRIHCRTLFSVPGALFRYSQDSLHQYFPNWINPVCEYSSDFLCHQTNGMHRLADALPGQVMEGLELAYENPAITATVVALTVLTPPLVYYYCTKKPAPSTTSTPTTTPTTTPKTPKKKTPPT